MDKHVGTRKHALYSIMQTFTIPSPAFSGDLTEASVAFAEFD